MPPRPLQLPTRTKASEARLAMPTCRGPWLQSGRLPAVQCVCVCVPGAALGVCPVCAAAGSLLLLALSLSRCSLWPLGLSLELPSGVRQLAPERHYRQQRPAKWSASFSDHSSTAPPAGSDSFWVPRPTNCPPAPAQIGRLGSDCEDLWLVGWLLFGTETAMISPSLILRLFPANILGPKAAADGGMMTPVLVCGWVVEAGVC